VQSIPVQFYEAVLDRLIIDQQAVAFDFDLVLVVID